MKAMRIGINLTAFALVSGFGLRPKAACATGCPDEGVYWHSDCSSMCQPAYCGTHMPLAALQCNDGHEECNQCDNDDTKYQMNCISFNT